MIQPCLPARTLVIFSMQTVAPVLELAKPSTLLEDPARLTLLVWSVCRSFRPFHQQTLHMLSAPAISPISSYIMSPSHTRWVYKVGCPPTPGCLCYRGLVCQCLDRNTQHGPIQYMCIDFIMQDTIPWKSLLSLIILYLESSQSTLTLMML